MSIRCTRRKCCLVEIEGGRCPPLTTGVHLQKIPNPYDMSEQRKATKLSEISRFASPKPLDESTWHMWVDTELARGNGAVLRLIEQLRQAHPQPDPVKILFAGHAGSGKSTELFRVKREVEQLYHVILARIGERYTLPTIDYRQVLFFCASQLVEVGAQLNALIKDRDEAKLVLDWFDKQTKEEVSSDGHNLSMEGGAKFSFFTALFAKFSGKIYSGGETKETAIKHIESRLDQLRLNMQIIVRAIEEKLAGKKLLLVLEDLDKIEDRTQGYRLFFEHRLQLLDIPCSLILTFPIALWYEQDANVQSYPIRYLLPMIPVSALPADATDAQPTANKAATGRAMLRQLLFQRLDEHANLLAPDALDYLVAYSGGVLRDLLYLLREAAIGATIRNGTQIELNDVRTVTRSLRNEYANRLSPRMYGEDAVSLASIDETLGNLTDWPKRTADRPAAFRMLLQSLCILEYNGEQWFDLHPAIREYLEIRHAERQTRKNKKSQTSRSARSRSR